MPSHIDFWIESLTRPLPHWLFFFFFFLTSFKTLGYFLKRLFTQKQTGRNIYVLMMSAITKCVIRFDTRPESKVRHFCFMFSLVFVTFFIIFWTNRPVCRKISTSFHQLTAAAFNSVVFLFKHPFISCKYVQNKTDLIYFVSLLEVYDETFKNVLLLNIC